MFRKIRSILIVCLVAVAAAPCPLMACATCFGNSDSDLARGMNWGILSLLVVIVGVLSAFATFFVYIARRSSALASRLGDSAATGTPKDVS